MSELILMLIITVLICGGVPYLAISYVNGKIKFPNTKTSNKKLSNSKALLLTALILGTFFNCFLFPVLSAESLLSAFPVIPPSAYIHLPPHA